MLHTKHQGWDQEAADDHGLTGQLHSEADAAVACQQSRCLSGAGSGLPTLPLAGRLLSPVESLLHVQSN